MAESLTGRQRRHLRALGHNLSPVLFVGKEGLSEPVVAALDDQLLAHELVKVRFGQNSPALREGAADELARQTRSHIAQVIGHTVLLYRRHPDKPRLKLP